MSRDIGRPHLTGLATLGVEEKVYFYRTLHEKNRQYPIVERR